MSLTAGWFIATLTIAAFGLLATSVLLDRRRVVLAAIGAACVVTGGIALWFRLDNPIRATFPASFFVWGAAPIVALAVATVTWRRSSWLRRVMRVAAVPVCAAFAAATINAHYAYIPTLAALRGQHARDQVTHQAARAIAHRAATTDTLPPRGVVLAVQVPVPHSHFHARAAYVYLPPVWFDNPRPALPVVMLVAGSPGTPADWTRSASADVIFDEYAATHGGRAPVLVMPDVNGGPFDDTECVDGPRGMAETYVLDDLRPFVIARYGVAADARSWAIGGLSEGGTCALVLALRHPDAFATFADFGGQAAPAVAGNDLRELYGGDRAEMRAHTPASLLRTARFPDVGGWFEVGSGDMGAHAAARQLAPMVAASGGEACLVERKGSHNFTFWHDSLRHSLPWLVARIGLEPSPPAARCRAGGGRIVSPWEAPPRRPPPR